MSSELGHRSPSETEAVYQAPPVDLPDFLFARIAEDEAIACREVDVYACWSGGETEQDLTHVADIPPGRLMADCAMKRDLVEWAAPVLTNWPGGDAEGFRYIHDEGLEVLRILAQPYSGHQDYRDEWRP